MKQSQKLATPLGLCLTASFCMATVAVAQSGMERARARQQAGQTAQLRAAVAEVLRQRAQDPAVLLAAALEQMSRQFPQEASEAAASSAFGVPHPQIARSYRPELLHLPLFPALMGYSSRLLAESWESSNLYWAQLADELGLPPAELNRIVPQLTRRMLEGIFANHLEDWPAMLTAMRATGEEFRRKAPAEAASPALAAAGP